MGIKLIMKKTTETKSIYSEMTDIEVYPNSYQIRVNG